MSFDPSSLEPHIRKVLTAPGTDLSRISAKGVRQKLIRAVPELTPEFVKENKEQIDVVISGVYASVSGVDEASDNADDAEKDEIGDAPSGDESGEARKRKHGSDEEHEEEAEPKPKKARKGASANGAAAKKATRPKKRAANVASDAESEDEKKKKKKKSKRKPAGEGSGAKGGFAKEFTLSDPLAEVVGVEKLSRPQVVKQLWVYIKEHKLQNPENGKEILLDDKMKAVFGGDRIDMFAMNKALGT
ncbi:hypothetical protein M378DRAFT_71009 [Amanita muscaria Koide BX008]|uniref:DM2 domain-containing protein n=1 Tax=Amanita muscaria (strain Koide BX008) TaxID=946122 RepID=A0A0C2XIJ6_AMAMK|nr:hypothetical protein M378DRAFT_71009 [Amanita muscaria Koide BX008]